MTIVMVTHELGFAREVADRIVLMSEGKIIDHAPTDAFFATGRDPRTEEFLATARFPLSPHRRTRRACCCGRLRAAARVALGG